MERLLPAPRLSGALELPQDQSVDLKDSALRPVVATLALAKGDLWGDGAPSTFLSLEGWLASPIFRNFGAAYGGGLGIRHDLDWLSVFGSVTYSAKGVDDDGFAYQYRAFTAGGGAALRLRLSTVGLLLGARAGASWASQALLNGEHTQGLVGEAGPMVSLLTPLIGSRVWARTTAQASAHTFILNGERVVRGSVQLQLALEVGL